jgi:glycosyltransferase involved in cell wall biosynthesis
VCGGSVGLPNGTAPTVRATCYARASLVLGLEAEIHVVGPSEPAEGRALNDSKAGDFRGCRYIYTCGTVRRPKSRVAHVFVQGFGILRSVARVANLRRRGRLCAVLIYTDTLRVAIPFALLAATARFPLLRDVCEVPLTKSGMPVVSYLGRKRVWLGYSLFQGVFPISDLLCSYVCDHARGGLRVLKMPVLADVHAIGAGRSRGSPRQIVYAGTLSQRKDGVETLIEAFAALPEADADVQLVVIGSGPTAKDDAACRLRARQLGLDDRVRFLGRLERDKTTEVIRTASALALARPQSLQADAGFPTKLAEYLATGRPVVTTSTGEISKYLVDRVSAFLVPPGDVGTFAQALHEALIDSQKTRAIGARGRQVALDCFDFRVNASKLLALLDAVATRPSGGH